MAAFQLAASLMVLLVSSASGLDIESKSLRTLLAAEREKKQSASLSDQTIEDASNTYYSKPASHSHRHPCETTYNNKQWHTIKTRGSAVAGCGSREAYSWGSKKCQSLCCVTMDTHCRSSCTWMFWDFSKCVQTCMGDRGCGNGHCGGHDATIGYRMHWSLGKPGTPCCGYGTTGGPVGLGVYGCMN